MKLSKDMIGTGKVDHYTRFERIYRTLNREGSDKATRHRFDILYRHVELTCTEIQFGRPRILEIGVFEGASLKAWHSLWDVGMLVGYDRDPRLPGPLLDVYRHQIALEKGDQGDLDRLSEVARKHGPFDLVIDDGSHRYDHQKQSFELLWPHVHVGGYYVCEDLHTSCLTTEPRHVARYNPTNETETALDYFLRLTREAVARRGEVDEETGATTRIPSMEFVWFSSAVAIRKVHDGQTRAIL